MLDVIKTDLEGVIEIKPKKFGDHRGFFSETYNARVLAEIGIKDVFVQDNHSFSAQKGVLRGLHFQTAPFEQAKLVRVTRGSAFDVAIDIRKNSPTFKKWVAVVLSAEKWNQFYIPAGFAHGFVTLEDNVEFLYKVSNYYAPESDRSIRYDDPEIAIDWPIDLSNVQLSEKDKNAPFLKDVELK